MSSTEKCWKGLNYNMLLQLEDVNVTDVKIKAKIRVIRNQVSNDLKSLYTRKDFLPLKSYVSRFQRKTPNKNNS